MTLQLTKTQIDAIKVELAKYGLGVTVAKPRKSDNSEIARLKAWKPETAAGRACKSNRLYWLSLPPIQGVSRYYRTGTGIFYSPCSNDPAVIEAWWKRSAKGHLRRVTPPRLLIGYRPTKVTTIHERA